MYMFSKLTQDTRSGKECLGCYLVKSNLKRNSLGVNTRIPCTLLVCDDTREECSNLRLKIYDAHTLCSRYISNLDK